VSTEIRIARYISVRGFNYGASPFIPPTRQIQTLCKARKAVEAHRVVRRRGSHIFYTFGLTDGGEVVSLTLRPSFTPDEDSWYSFLLETESSPKP
jgi:hypothetical protein